TGKRRPRHLRKQWDRDRRTAIFNHSVLSSARPAASHLATAISAGASAHPIGLSDAASAPATILLFAGPRALPSRRLIVFPGPWFLLVAKSTHSSLIFISCSSPLASTGDSQPL